QPHKRRTRKHGIGELKKLSHEEIRSHRADGDERHDDHQQAHAGRRQVQQPIDFDEGDVDEVDGQGDGNDDDQAAQEVLYDPVHDWSVASIARMACRSRSFPSPDTNSFFASNSSSASRNSSCSWSRRSPESRAGSATHGTSMSSN